MLYTSSVLDERERSVVADINDLRDKLKYALHEPSRWSNSLRRL